MANGSNYHQPPPLQNILNMPQGYMPLNPEGIDLANLAAWHMARIGQMGYLAAPPEGSLALPIGLPANPAATSKRVWLDEPPGSVPFDEQASAALTGIAGTTQTVLSFKVPAGFDGVIKWISNNIIDGVFIEGTITWGIFINDRPVRNFGIITEEKGTIAQGRIISPIRIFANNVITYEITEVLGGQTGRTVVSATGYYYPSKGVS
jgi:hypothetical protein